MARSIYGASGAAQVVSPTGAPTVASATVKTARTGGTTVTDVQNMSNANLGGIVTPDSRGQVIFQGPDNFSSTLWLDFGDGGPRWAVTPVDMSVSITNAMAARELAQYTTPSGTTPKAALPYTANHITQKLALALDPLVTKRFASAAARNAAFPTPADGDRVYRTDLHAHQTWRAMGSGARWVTDMGVIYEGRLSSTASIVTFSGIPQEWTHLVVKYKARAATSPAGDEKTSRVGVRFNNDNSANYNAWGAIRNSRLGGTGGNYYDSPRGGTSASGSNTGTSATLGTDQVGMQNYTNLGVTTAHIGVCPGSDFSTLFGGGEITVDDYTNASTRKAIKGITGFLDGASSTYQSNALIQGGWSNNAAITQVDLFVVNGTFAIGSQFSLYGWS